MFFFALAALHVPVLTEVCATPTDLRSAPLSNRLGLHLNEYALSWTAPEQASFHILVASDAQKLAAGVGDLWDSGRRYGGAGEGIRCRGSAFPDGATVWWRVRVWDDEGVPGDWSQPAKIDVPAISGAVKPVRRPTASDGKRAFVDGRHGKAVRIDASSRISVPDYPGLRSTAGTTIAVWMRPDETPDRWQCLYRKEDGARRLLAIGKEGPFWGIWSGFVIGGKYEEFGAPFDPAGLADGRWHHVAASYDGKRVALFVDGKKIGEQTRSGVLESGGGSSAYIGSYGGNSEKFHGALDDLRIYTVGLSGTQIAALAAGEQEVASDQLAARWRFDGDVGNEATFTPETTRNRIVFLGGTLVYEMEKHGHFETAVTAHWPHHDITFRNLGWPADDVFGTARSEFGSAQNTRSWKPPGAEAGFGYREMMKQVREAQPTTMIVGYGGEAAFADTEAKMRDFENGYARLIADLEKTGATLILLTPIPQEKHGRVLPDPADRNERLKSAADFILDLAKERDHRALDLFRSRIPTMKHVSYRNGFLPDRHGHQMLGMEMADRLGLGCTFEIRPVVGTENGMSIDVRSALTEHQVQTKRGFRWDQTLDQLPAGSDTLGVTPPWDPDQAGCLVRIGGVEVENEALMGLAYGTGPDFEQTEALRLKIVEKNRFHRHKIRPINKAYVFLFRRHEMGHLAHEMEDFDALIAGHEREIAHLRVPRTHVCEIERVDPWKPPRDYPDHEVPREIPAPEIEAELRSFTVAEGFEVNLFAEVSNPINLNWDTRGRAWVSTSPTYPHIVPGKEPNDRIVVLEDTNGDGVADEDTTVAWGLTVPHSVMPLPDGGAYVCSATEFLHLAKHPNYELGHEFALTERVLFSGFGNADVHHMIHGLRWAPWGDLHFIQSIYINSFVETAHGPRRMNGSGIWKFRPETERLDAFAVGMVNPWGLAFDDWGQSFGTDGAGGSGPHYVFPGAAFPSAVGAHRVLRGLIPGKPKNTAAEFVSGRHMPDHWQGSLLANDFRANRTVRYALKESGSGYTASEVETVLHSSHRSFRPADIKMGPDGAVYVVDWYNPIIDHGEVDFHHPLRDKSHGRIWRITAKGRPLVERPSIAGAPSEDLLDLLKAPEQYTRTQANRELASRPCQGLVGPITRWIEALDPADPHYERHRLEGFWLLAAHRAASAELVEKLLRSPDHHVRAAAARAVGNGSARSGKLDPIRLLAPAVEDAHPQVRLEAINALRAVGTLPAVNLALRALDHPTDGNISFALELTVRALREVWLPAMQSGKQVFDGVPSRLSYALREANDPRAIERLVEVLKSDGIANEDLPGVVTTIAAFGKAGDVALMLAMAGKHHALLPAIARGASENRNAVPKNAEKVLGEILEENWQPETWIAAANLYADWNLRGSAVAVGSFLGSAEDPDVALAMAKALAKLGGGDALRSTMKSLRLQPHVRAAAAAGLAGADPSGAAADAVTVLGLLDDAKLARPIFAAFIAHRDGPNALTAALKERMLPEHIAIAGARLAHASGRELPDLVAALNTAGLLKPVSQNLSVAERTKLLADAVESGDVERGLAIYERKSLLCTTCHVIDNKGGKLGPDLTTVGTYMTPESLLESLLNPSTDIKQGYETMIVTRRRNAIVSGLLQRKTETATLVRDPSGAVVSIPNDDIEKLDSSPVSLMPPGLTAQLRRDELVDLMAFLTSLGKPPREDL